MMAKAKFFRQLIGIIPTTLLLAFLLYVVSASIFAVSSAEESSTSTEVHVSVSNPSDSQTSALGYFIRLVSETSVEMSILPTRDGEIGVATDNVYAWTNSPTGYKLYLSSATDSNKLYLDGNTTSAHYFGPTASSALDNDSWGYGLNATSFSAVPVKGAEVFLKSTQEANQYAAMDDALTKTPVYYGAKADYELPAGNYTGTVLYTALAEATESSSPGIAVSPTTLKNFTGGETLTISTTLFTNIEDAGDVTVKVGDDTCTVTSVETGYDAANGTLTIQCILPAKPELQKSYDVYVTVPKFGKSYTLADGITYEFENKLASVSTMQGLTKALCAATTTPAAFNEDGTINADVPQGILSDIRDGNSYVVRKLADGNCWMSENLRLGKAGTTYTLTSANSDVTSDFILPAAQTSGNSIWNDNTEHVYVTGNQSFGNYYNWYTATAGEGTTSLSSTDVPSSICPKNWDLPRISSSSLTSFYNLFINVYGLDPNSATDSAVIRVAPLSFVLSGYYTGGNLSGQNENGRYWSSIAHSIAGSARYLSLSSNSFLSMPYSLESAGYSVRCVVPAN